MNALSKIFALSSDGNARNVILVALAFEAPLESGALYQAVGKVIKRFPSLAAVLEEHRAGQGFTSYRKPMTDDTPSARFVETLRLNDIEPGTDLFEQVVGFLEPHLDKKLDLTLEPAATLFLIDVGGWGSVLALIAHHSVADAWVGCEFLGQMVAEYNVRATGLPPIVSKGEQATSVGRSRRSHTDSRPPRLSSRDFPALWPRKAETGIPFGTGTRTDLGYNVSRIAFTARQTQLIKDKARDLSVDLVDLLTASAHVTIEEWNSTRHVDTAMITTSMSVPVQGIIQPPEEPNRFSLIHLTTDERQRCDRQMLPMTMRIQRKRLGQSGMASKQSQFMSLLISLGSVLPESLQKRITSFLFDRLQWYRAAIQINFLGEVTPESICAPRTGRSELVSCGGAKCIDGFGFPYKTVPTATPIQVHAFEFREEFQIIVGSWSSHFRGSETMEFTQLLGNALLRTSGNKLDTGPLLHSGFH